MNFLYPDTIAVSRLSSESSAGIGDYSGALQSNELPVASGIQAHIQADRQGTRPDAKLAADAAGQSIWLIIFKAAADLVNDRDIITDGRGRRFQVISADPGSLLTTCRCQILET